jgi:hypothetical protein
MMSSDWVFPLHRNLNPTSKSVKTAEFSEMLGTLSAVGQRRSFPKVPQPLQYVIGGNRFGKVKINGSPFGSVGKSPVGHVQTDRPDEPACSNKPDFPVARQPSLLDGEKTKNSTLLRLI